jgi:hypothetical protein
MVFTIEEILEKSRRDANGVTFEEALKHTSELKLSLKSSDSLFCLRHRIRKIPLLAHLHLRRLHGERFFRDNGDKLCFASGRV